MVCSHFILNISLFMTKLNRLSLKLKLSEKNNFILYYGFFKYKLIYKTVWNRLMMKARFLLHRLNITYMQWWKSMCSLSQLMKNETKHSAYSRAQYTISSLKFNQEKGEMLLLSRLLSVVIDIILFLCLFFK
jgi:hypothetical protein